MLEIVLDTETTGLSPAKGHRMVEIGCVEIENYVPTGRVYHQYINPLRDMPEEAFRVHGLSEEFLSDKPNFGDVAKDFLDFVGDKRLVIHNVAFDMSFINYELRKQGYKKIDLTRCLDTVQMARRKFPGARASLDALCQRFKVDNSGREKHGALLDAELLAEVYLHLRGGPQPSMAIDIQKESQSVTQKIERTFRKPRTFDISEAEQKAHLSFINNEINDAIWKKYSKV